jgi:hypothetical protein
MKVMVFQWPNGADAWRRCPQGLRISLMVSGDFGAS